MKKQDLKLSKKLIENINKIINTEKAGKMPPIEIANSLVDKLNKISNEDEDENIILAIKEVVALINATRRYDLYMEVLKNKLPLYTLIKAGNVSQLTLRKTKKIYNLSETEKLINIAEFLGVVEDENVFKLDTTLEVLSPKVKAFKYILHTKAIQFIKTAKEAVDISAKAKDMAAVSNTEAKATTKAIIEWLFGRTLERGEVVTATDIKYATITCCKAANGGNVQIAKLCNDRKALELLTRIAVKVANKGNLSIQD